MICTTPALADGPENALLIEAITQWEAAQSAAPAERLAALQAAQDAIDTLLRDYAQTDLAVDLVLNRADTPFTRSELGDAIT